MYAISMKTNSDLLETLANAVKVRPTREQIEKQRVSFAYSIMPVSPENTRQKIEAMVEQQTGE